MYNAYLTSDYTTQVEELDNSYGTAQDWADLHEYEEQELQQASNRVRVIDWNDGKALLINWFKADIKEVLAALKIQLQYVDPSIRVYITDDDAERIMQGTGNINYTFMFNRNIHVIDDYNTTLEFSVFSMQ